MNLLPKIKAALADMKRTELLDIERKSGVSYFTMLKIVSGETSDPRLSTIEAIYNALPKSKK